MHPRQYPRGRLIGGQLAVRLHRDLGHIHFSVGLQSVYVWAATRTEEESRHKAALSVNRMVASVIHKM